MGFQPLDKGKPAFTEGWGAGRKEPQAEEPFVAWEVLARAFTPGGLAGAAPGRAPAAANGPDGEEGAGEASPGGEEAAAPDAPRAVESPGEAATPVPPRARQEVQPPHPPRPSANEPPPSPEEILAPLRAEIEEERARCRALLEQLQAMRQQLIAAARRDMVEAIWTVVTRVLLAEVRADRGLVERIVDAVCDELSREDHVVLRVCPRDHAWLSPRQDELGRRAGVARLVVEPDRTVEAGGCVIDVPSGRIDASLTARLDAFRAELDRFLGTEILGREED